MQSLSARIKRVNGSGRINIEGMSRLVRELMDSAMDKTQDYLVRSGLDEEQIAELTQRAYSDADKVLTEMLAKINAKWGHLGQPMNSRLN